MAAIVHCLPNVSQFAREPRLRQTSHARRGAKEPQYPYGQRALRTLRRELSCPARKKCGSYSEYPLYTKLSQGGTSLLLSTYCVWTKFRRFLLASASYSTAIAVGPKRTDSPPSKATAGE